MKLQIERQEDLVIVQPAGPRLDAGTTPQFKSDALAAIEDSTRGLVVDLAQVQFVDSTGLGAMVSLLKKLAPKGKLALANVTSPRIKQLLKLTRMDKILKSYDSLEEALSALQDNG